MHFCEHFAQLKVLPLHRTHTRTQSPAHTHTRALTHTHTLALTPCVLQTFYFCCCRCCQQRRVVYCAICHVSAAATATPAALTPVFICSLLLPRSLPRAVNAATAPFASFIKQLLSSRCLFLFLFHFLLLCVVLLACCLYPSAAAAAAAARNLCCKLFAVAVASPSACALAASACFFVLLLLLRHIPLAPNKSNARCLLPLLLSLSLRRAALADAFAFALLAVCNFLAFSPCPRAVDCVCASASLSLYVRCLKFVLRTLLYLRCPSLLPVSALL